MKLKARTPFLLAFVAALLVTGASGVLAQDATSKAPNAGAMTEAVLQGLEANPTAKYVASAAGTTPVDLFDSDLLTSAQQNKQHVQLITITNIGSSGYVCLHLMDWGDTCATENAGCLNASNTRAIVLPGQAREFIVKGTQDVCGVASAAAVQWQAEGLGRIAGAR